MPTQRQGERLPEWRDAVAADPSLSWSSSAVESDVNRITMLKRQMFGCGGFQLLRERVLLA
ncbi:hypothetical protein ACFQ7N_26615 [Streptomyces niveus]|uniref:hypothetical protein n=1 Tax=Streptomyces niveus TaxID=193462 RepID=UPI00367DDEF3